MKTTVKDFILDHMTDSNFEKLVNTLIIEGVRSYFWDNEMTDLIVKYLNKHTSYPNNNTFEILNEIKTISNEYFMNYKEEFVETEFLCLNNTKPQCPPTANSSDDKLDPEFKIETAEVHPPLESVEMPITNSLDDDLEPELELDIEFDFPNVDPSIDLDPSMIDTSKFKSFSDLNIAFLSKTYPEIEKNYLDPWDLNATNYEEYVHQEKNRIALGLSNFIYEILHNDTENKLENKFEQFSNERSHVKIDDDNEYWDGYCVHFLLDHRSRYVSEERKKSYYDRYRSLFNEEDLAYYRDDFFEFPVTQPDFVEYEVLWQDLLSEYNYILAPFTDYLNEELIVPKVSEEVVYDILEQFIHILTYQGFTVGEQIGRMYDSNEEYERTLL